MLDSTVAAVMYAQLGDIDAAFAATRKSPPPNRQLLSWLFSAAATKMRADPRFMPLAARLGLVDYWQSTGKWPDFCIASNAPYDCRAEARKFASTR